MSIFIFHCAGRGGQKLMAWLRKPFQHEKRKEEHRERKAGGNE
jgi:hypothetical protein